MTIRHPPRQVSSDGFTLIEIMLVVIILGVLLTIGLPSFRTYISEQKVKNASFDLVAALTLTRSEAIKRNADVSLSKTGSEWGSGWSVDVGGTPIQSWGPYSGITLTAVGVADSIAYSSNGRLSPVPSSPIRFTIDDSASSAIVKARCIKIDASGRPNSRLLESGSCL